MNFGYSYSFAFAKLIYNFQGSYGFCGYCLYHIGFQIGLKAFSNGLLLVVLDMHSRLRNG